MSAKKGSVAPFVVTILIVLLLAGMTWYLRQPEPTFIQGEMEATQIDLATKIAGRVSELMVREGDQTRTGQRLAILDSPEIRAKLEQAAAARSAASAQRDKALTGAREEDIRAAKNMWLRAEHGAQLAERTFHRIERLYADGVVPAQRRDEAEVKWKTAREATQAAKAQYDLALAGARKEDREAAEAVVEQASGVVTEVESLLEETTVRSPLDAEVVQVLAQPGELVTPGYPVISLVDLNDIWATFQLREDRLSGFKMGTVFQGQVPALGGQNIQLKVTYISPLGDFATWRATNASGGFDLKTFEVRARTVKPVEGLRPGMSVIVPLEAVGL